MGRTDTLTIDDDLHELPWLLTLNQGARLTYDTATNLDARQLVKHAQNPDGCNKTHYDTWWDNICQRAGAAQIKLLDAHTGYDSVTTHIQLPTLHQFLEITEKLKNITAQKTNTHTLTIQYTKHNNARVNVHVIWPINDTVKDIARTQNLDHQLDISHINEQTPQIQQLLHHIFVTKTLTIPGPLTWTNYLNHHQHHLNTLDPEQATYAARLAQKHATPTPLNAFINAVIAATNAR